MFHGPIGAHQAPLCARLQAYRSYPLLIYDGEHTAFATNDFYAVATVLMLGSVVVVWLIKRPKGPLKTVTH